MQIYTRTGDKGKTKIMGGQALYKDDPKIEAYGTVDELNSVMGLARAKADFYPELAEDLLSIQYLLFDCGNDLATPLHDDRYSYRTDASKVEWLESKIDFYSQKAPEVKSFILPGGTEISAVLHIARSVCRRAERRIVTYMQKEEINQHALKFINRVSDFCFVAARACNAKLGVKDITYNDGGEVFHLDIGKADIYKEAPDL